jgi:hypothetical protein
LAELPGCALILTNVSLHPFSVGCRKRSHCCNSSLVACSPSHVGIYLGIPLSVSNLKKDLKTFDHSKIRYTPFHVSQLYPNGCDTSFWFDVWYEEDCLADKFPALLSHCKRTDLSRSKKSSLRGWSRDLRRGCRRP